MTANRETLAEALDRAGDRTISIAPDGTITIAGDEERAVVLDPKVESLFLEVERWRLGPLTMNRPEDERPAAEVRTVALVEGLALALRGAEAVLAMTVGRLGGNVEGRPTARLNFLQRIDELREIERLFDEEPRR